VTSQRSYPYPCEKCKTCNCATLVTHTFNNITRLDEKDWYYACSAAMEYECAVVDIREAAENWEVV
jgi:hypothetical protein